MPIKRSLLDDAVGQGLLQADQVEALWRFVQEKDRHTPSFRFTHILYYLGGMTAIGAMTLFMTLGWERFGGWGLLGISLVYGVGGVLLTGFLLRREHFIPAGLIAALVVAIAPLAIYGLQLALGYWPEGQEYRDYHRYVDWRWMLMELGTLVVGVVMLWRYRLPFLVMPVAVTLWYMTMDLTPFLFGSEDYSWDLRKLVSLYSGLLIILLAFWVDIRTRKGDQDYPFWLYLFGVIAFWGGLSLMRSDDELGKFLYFCLNIGMILIGAMLSRRVFVVFGALGAAGYAGYLAYDLFEDSLLFPFALTAIGLFVIYLGILWQRHEERLTERLRRHLPVALRELLTHR